MTTAPALRAQAPDGTDPTQALALVRRLAMNLGNHGLDPVIRRLDDPATGLALSVLLRALADLQVQDRAVRREVTEAWRAGGLDYWLAHLDLSSVARARISALFDALCCD